MGPKLRMLGENQLSEDLGIYEISASMFHLIGLKVV